MMMGDKKKIAAIIIKGMGHSPKETPTDYYSDHKEDSDKEEDFRKTGMEAAMEDFIKAVHAKDVDKAIMSFQACMECSDESSDDYSDSYMGDSKEGE